MSFPSYDRFIEPILRFLAAHPEGARAREAIEAAADALAQHAQPLPPEDIERIAIAIVDVRLRTGAEGSAKAGDT